MFQSDTVDKGQSWGRNLIFFSVQALLFITLYVLQNLSWDGKETTRLNMRNW